MILVGANIKAQICDTETGDLQVKMDFRPSPLQHHGDVVATENREECRGRKGRE